MRKQNTKEEHLLVHESHITAKEFKEKVMKLNNWTDEQYEAWKAEVILRGLGEKFFQKYYHPSFWDRIFRKKREATA